MNKQEKNKQNKIIRLVLLLVFTILTVLGYVFSTELFSDTSVFKTTVLQNQALNKVFRDIIPSTLKSIQIVTIFILIFIVIKFLLTKLFSKTNKGITVAKLTCSFLKYTLAIVAILIILSAFGVDTTTLLASVGILTLVIGLGAQSLIADVIAGLFIVFENEFQVGDIVVIEGWRGTVSEIGIRSTRIVDAGGNIKIINNSSIGSIINQTEQLSIAKCIIGTEYSANLEEIEKVIGENLQKIAQNIPQIVEGPFYKGVAALNSSSVDLLFIAKCEEENIYQVQRDLNRAIKLMFDANKINVPFQQVVLNQANNKTDNSNNIYSKK